MKLLTKAEARASKKRENDALVDSNIRLRGYYNTIVQRLNTVREDYEPEKLQKLNEFEQFCKDLQVKREKLLTEYAQWEKALEDKKELYYALVAKQDALEEVRANIEEENRKLDLREAFVVDLEEKWKNKQQ